MGCAPGLQYHQRRTRSIPGVNSERTNAPSTMRLRCSATFRAMCSGAALLLVSPSEAVTVDEAILRDTIPTGSDMCADPGTTTVDFTFSPSTASGWDPKNAPYEEETFLAEMRHQDSDPNRTWTMRLGRGGNIYSFIGPYGEAVPPQYTNTSAWVDDVSYMGVAVDGSQNSQAAPHFIHQAGTYMGDSPFTPPAFYSPNVAKHCEGHSCSFASWGQQAHVPTAFKSDLLYLYEYRDCGDGVMEVTQVFQNNADPNIAGGDSLSYMNTPWGGIRPSVFADLLLSNSSGQLEFVENMHGWGGDTDATRPQLSTTGGFSTFTQDYPNDDPYYQLPCVNKNDDTLVKETCTEDDYNNGYEDFKLVVQQSNPCAYDSRYAPRFGVRCQMSQTRSTPINEYCDVNTCNGGLGFWFTNNRTGSSIKVLDVTHWSWTNGKSYFSTPGFSNVNNVNALFQQGDEIIVTRVLSKEAKNFQMPCYNDTNHVKEICTESDYNNGYTDLKLVVQQNNPCQAVNIPKWAPRYGVRCMISPRLNLQIDEYCLNNCGDGLGFLFTNNRTGYSNTVLDVEHWSWYGGWSYFSTDADENVLNAQFQQGDEIIVTRVLSHASTDALTVEDNLALTFVHGKAEWQDDILTEKSNANFRLRYGTTGASRDYTVFTVNSWQFTIEPGETFFFRQYMINDRLVNMESSGSTWAVETDADILGYEDYVALGRTIELYSNNDQTVFGAAAADAVGGNTTNCLQGTSQCVGSSTPKNGHKAFFEITCAGASYFGPDQYNFAPNRSTEQDPIRPYACEGEGTSVRPSFKMIGYFPINDSGCEALENAAYDPDFCTN